MKRRKGLFVLTCMVERQFKFYFSVLVETLVMAWDAPILAVQYYERYFWIFLSYSSHTKRVKHPLSLQENDVLSYLTYLYLSHYWKSTSLRKTVGIVYVLMKTFQSSQLDVILLSMWFNSRDLVEITFINYSLLDVFKTYLKCSQSSSLSEQHLLLRNSFERWDAALVDVHTEGSLHGSMVSGYNT